jgi:hypothetical protein
VAKRARNRQVLDAIGAAGGDLANTPAICRKGDVHEIMLDAFEGGMLGKEICRHAEARTGGASG